MKDKQGIKILTWINSKFPDIGTLLVGIAALIALSQTSDVLKQVFVVQEQAKEIKHAVDTLGTLIIALTSREIISNSAKLQSTKSITVTDAESAIKDIPRKPSGTGSVFLPENKEKETIERLVKASSPMMRTQILQDSLEIKKPEK